MLCNSAAAIEALKPRVRWGKSALGKVAPGNPRPVRSATPLEKRDQFIAGLAGGMGIERLMTKCYFKPSLVKRVHSKLSRAKRRVRRLHPLVVDSA